MYSVNKYNDYSNDFAINYEGNTDNIEEAIEYCKKKVNNMTNCQSIAVIIDENNSDEDEIETYITFDDTSDIINIFRSKMIYRINEIQCEEILTQISDKNKILKNNITIKDLVEYFGFSDNLKEQFEFDEFIYDKIEIQKYVIDYLISINYNLVNDIIDLTIYNDSCVFVITKNKNLPKI
jgi:hypothetical protein